MKHQGEILQTLALQFTFSSYEVFYEIISVL